MEHFWNKNGTFQTLFSFIIIGRLVEFNQHNYNNLEE